MKGKLSKTHGGASLKNEADFELLFSTRLKRSVIAKKKIAEKAAEFVQDGDIIAIDTGTTAMLFAGSLKGKKNVSAITPSLGAAQELLSAKGVYTVLLGGDLKEETMSTAGPMTLEHIQKLRVNKFFMGAVAFDPYRGTQDAYLFEAETKKALMAIATERIVMVDSTKFGKNSLGLVAALKDIQTLITDNGISEEHRHAVLSSGINLIEV